MEKKTMTAKEIEDKITELKIELLKNVTKKKSIKKEIARLLTMKNQPKLNKNTLVDVSQKEGGNK